MVSAIWKTTASPSFGYYNNGAYWHGNVVPDDQATFSQSNYMFVQITNVTNVNSWVFAFPQAYIFTLDSTLNFNGAGVIGGPGVILDNNGVLTFNGASTAGILSVTNDNAMLFTGGSTAGFSSITNKGTLQFLGGSTAGNATIVVSRSGTLEFAEGSTGGNATIAIEVVGGIQQGRVTFSGDGPAHNHKVTVGSIVGGGTFDLGSNQLTVGSTNLSHTVTGAIAGSSRASLVKVGNGTLTLNGATTYGGVTRVEGGVLEVNTTIGKAIVDGAQLIGNGTLGATIVKDGLLSPGQSFYAPGVLNTGKLDVQQRGEIFATIQTGNVADQIKVRGTVKLGGELTVSGPSGGTGSQHTFVIINNDGKDKVKGHFSGGLTGEFTEGEGIESNGGVYSISYKGGTGNDVVLRTEGVIGRGTDAADLITTKTAPPGAEHATGRADLLLGLNGDDTIKAGKGNDTVFSTDGIDNLDGGAGNDLLRIGSSAAGVVVTLKGSKLSTIKTGGVADDKFKNFENVDGSSLADRITGDGKANILRGNDGADILKGGGGNDVLIGGDHKDVLFGGSGRDKFVFMNTDSFLWSTEQADVIKDFRHGQDKLQLDGYLFVALGDKVDSGELFAKAGANKARDGNDHLIYNTKNGKLFYDGDGNGTGEAPVLLAILKGSPTLSASDFVIV